jgi:hypothetical protein
MVKKKNVKVRAPKKEESKPVRPETPEQANARADACWKQVQKVLAEHGCQLGARIVGMEHVGDGSSALVRSAYGVFPIPRNQNTHG